MVSIFVQNKRAYDIIKNSSKEDKYTFYFNGGDYEIINFFQNIYTFHILIEYYLIERITLNGKHEIYNREKYKQKFYKMLTKQIERWSMYNRIAWHPKRLEKLGYFEET